MKKILSAVLLLALSISLLSCNGQITSSATKDEEHVNNNLDNNKSTAPKITAIEEMENYYDDAKQYRVTYENGTKMAFRILNDRQVMVCSNNTLNENYNPETDLDSEYSYNDYHGDIVIPESVIINDKEYMVTAIENNAFLDTDITSVIIPKTITTIEAGAFMHWYIEWAAAGSESAPLEKITVLEGNPRFDSRENCNAIIETATNTLVVGCKNTVIPEGVKRIGDWAFCNCDIASVTIPASVNEIGYYAFGYCYKLTSVTLQNQYLGFNFEDVFGGSNLQLGDIKRLPNWIFGKWEIIKNEIIEISPSGYVYTVNGKVVGKGSIEVEGNSLVLVGENGDFQDEYIMAEGKLIIVGGDGEYLEKLSK